MVGNSPKPHGGIAKVLSVISETRAVLVDTMKMAPAARVGTLDDPATIPLDVHIYVRSFRGDSLASGVDSNCRFRLLKRTWPLPVRSAVSVSAGQRRRRKRNWQRTRDVDK